MSTQTYLQPPDHEQIAIDRIIAHKDREHDSTYLAFSGGKDSIVIYDLAKRSGIPLEPNFMFTTVDPPELVKFVRDNYPEVTWNRPKRSMFQLIEHKHIPPTRMARYCCEELKEYGGRGRVVIDGVRWAESHRRSQRRLYERCNRHANTYYLHPIIDWTDNMVWDYIHSHNLKYCCLYDQGATRIGCIMCPLQSSDKIISEAKRWPKYYNAYMGAFRRMLKTKPASHKIQWKDADDVMHWYIYGEHLDDESQCELFG